MEAVFGVDVGTGSLKAGLFALDGTPLGIRRVAYPGSAEQNPRDWWNALADASSDLVDDRAIQIRAIAIGGQAPTLVPVDDNLEPTHAAITWLDPRTSDEAARLYARLGQTVPVWGSWPAQAAWFVRNRVEALQRTRWFLGAPDYILSRLICAPSALLALTPAELEAGDLDARWFPPVWKPGEVVGTVTESAARDLRIPPGTAVVGGHVDGLLGVLGSGVRRPGEACVNCGTSGTYSVVCPPPLGYPMFGVNVLGTATNTSGVALDWFAANITDRPALYTRMLAEVEAVEPGALGLLFIAQLAGDRGATPDAFARAAWVGLTLAHDRRHLLRALLEGIAFNFRSMQEWLIANGAIVRSLRCVGGQAHSEFWARLLADVLNQGVGVPAVVEAACLGAAILGSVAVGVHPDLDAAANAMVRIQRQFEPDPARAAVYSQLYAAHSELSKSLRATNQRLHELDPG